jgi:hypothetical protein
MLRTVTATRYVTPLREGGSLPAIVEADDDGLYVLKFRGAGQGPKALIAELLAGEIGRALGLPIPEIVIIDLDPVLGRNEPDPEIRDLILASEGLNLGLDFLPGAIGFDVAVDRVDPHLAACVAWFDAYVLNVDRTARNPNLLLWHRDLWLIDHGAALYFHHNWESAATAAASAFPLIRDHVLLPQAMSLAAVDAELVARLPAATLDAIVAALPDSWLSASDGFATPDAQRAAYRSFLAERLARRERFLEEAERARAADV